MVDVDTARRKLLEALGEYAERYWINMKLWYKQKISKDDFDTQAFELLGPGKINYHNEFILSILAKCQAIAASAPATHSRSTQKAHPKSLHLRKPRVKRRSEDSNTPQQGFISSDPLKTTPPFLSKGEDQQDISLCSQELVLPDISTLHGRLYLGAWDAGLDSIADETAPLLAAAVEAHLKNILQACISRKKPYAIRSGSHFQYKFGSAHMRSNLCNGKLYEERNVQQHRSQDQVGHSNSHRTYDQAEAEAYSQFASAEVRNSVLSPISLFDLRNTLQENQNIIPSHTVRTGNMERLLSNMWHPGHDEICQNELYILETRKLHEKLKQQRGLRV